METLFLPYPILNSEKSKYLTYKNYPLYRRIKDSFKGHFLSLCCQPCIRRDSSLEKDTKVLKRREKFEAENFFKALQYNITRIFEINSGNMFCSMHDFIRKTL